MDPTFFASPEELRDWFVAHHDSADELIVGYWKKHTGRPSVTWAQCVDEALCVGWIDGQSKRLDDDSHKQRFTPRRKGSHWSYRNIERVEVLRDEGRMTPAGEAAFAARSEAKTGLASHERKEPAVLEPEQEAAFKANAPAWEWFQGQPAGYRKTALHLVVSAKKPETREKRLAALIENSARGERIPQLRR